MTPVRERLHWLAMHAVVRSAAAYGARRGDLQSRLLVDPEVHADPVPFYEELRRRGPLIRSREGYLTADHGVAFELLRSDDFRVLIQGSSLPAPLRWLERHTRSDLLHPLWPPSLLAVEPPEHTRYRKTVSSVFTTRRIAMLRDSVDDTAAALLAKLSTESGVVDIVDRYCAQLPVTVISELLGVPDSERARILQFGELAAPSLDFGLSWPEYQQVERGLEGFNEWLVTHLDALRRNPSDSLLSQLTEASDAEYRLRDDELRGIAGLVLAAGFETTVNLLGNGIRLLLEHPDQLALLQDDPSLWSGAVEEILRYDSPVQLTVRLALRDTVVADRQIRAGEMVVLYLGAANRDPAVFEDPDRFDVRRPNAGRHLAFSGGRHFCLGAALARAEGEVGLRRVFSSFPGAELAGSGERRHTRVLRGWAELPVRLGEAEAVAG